MRSKKCDKNQTLSKEPRDRGGQPAEARTLSPTELEISFIVAFSEQKTFSPKDLEILLSKFHSNLL